MKALLFSAEGDISVIEVPQAGVAGIDVDDLQAVADGDCALIRWNEDYYQQADVDAEEAGEDTVYEITWSRV